MKFSILGLGESLKTFIPNGSTTIGVNDIYKHFKTDFVVCVDRPHVFSDERRKTIINSTPEKFFTFKGLYNDWVYLTKNAEGLKPALYRGPEHLDNPDTICYSNNSAFVACCIAYKMGAKEIVMYGVDFNTHPNFKHHGLAVALKDFKALRIALNKRNVNLFVSSRDSKLSTFIPVKPYPVI